MEHGQNKEAIFHFSNWFRTIAISKGYLFPQQVVSATLVSRDIIDLIWNAKQIPDEETLGKIAKALNVNNKDMLRAASFPSQS